MFVCAHTLAERRGGGGGGARARMPSCACVALRACAYVTERHTRHVHSTRAACTTAGSGPWRGSRCVRNRKPIDVTIGITTSSNSSIIILSFISQRLASCGWSWDTRERAPLYTSRGMLCGHVVLAGRTCFSSSVRQLHDFGISVASKMHERTNLTDSAECWRIL